MEYEPDAGQIATNAREYRWNLAGAILLSCATLASAWCAFQSSAWSDVYATESRIASVARKEAARHSAIADRYVETDVLLFLAWSEATIKGDEVVAAMIAQRFRPDFMPAYEAWLSLSSGTDGHLPDGSPFDREEYVLPAQQAADDAEARASQADVAADTAARHSHFYVLSTVLFASVLFLAGIADKLTHRGVSHAVVILAALTLAGAIVVLARLPVIVGGS
ncbi:MAG: hypothetical protein RBS78_07970 [Coriobacteriia bacterium]|jgi:hypothetical protein|nr:hypothetical protein [Coriobacteriia bacterium]